MIFVSYLTDFSYFPLKIDFPKVAELGQNWSNLTILKGDVDSFSYFSLISVILFSNQDNPWYADIAISHITKIWSENMYFLKAVKISSPLLTSSLIS